MMKNAVAYIRVSTEEQVKNGQGLKIQIKSIKDYCKLNKIKLVHEIFADEGVSGAKPTEKRPGLNDLFSFIISKDVDCIVVSKLDRLSRDVEFGANIKKKLDKLNVGIISISDGEFRGNNETSDAMFNISTSFAQLERKRISKRQIEGRIMKSENGGKANGTCPFGYLYRYNATGKKPVAIVDKEKLNAVKEMYSLYLQGLSFEKIANYLNDKGILTNRNNKWRADAIGTILKNDFYRGIVTYSGEKYNGIHEPIINSITFGKVQSSMKKRANKNQNTIVS